MKNLIFGISAGLVLLLISCNSIDQEVVDAVQTSINKVQESKPAVEDAAQNVANLREQMSAAPMGLKASPQFGYGTLLTQVDQFNQKYSSILQFQDELQSKLEALIGDYTDGKIKKEDVLKEHEALKPDVESIQKSLDRMIPMFDNLSAQYAKMLATWQSLPEAERMALSQESEPATTGASGAPGGGSLQQSATPGPVTKPHKSDALTIPNSGPRKQ